MKLHLPTTLRACRSALPFGFALGVLAIYGCSSSSGSGTTPPAADSGAPGTHDSGAAADTGSSATEAGGDDASTGALPLPFFVSDQFIPSGFMNDPTGISLSAGANGGPSCPTRAPSAGGDCYVVSWTSSGPAWAGVYWQYPSNNWGTQPGLTIASGAQSVSFYVRGDAGGEVVQFKVGGINDPVNPSTGTYGDSFEVSSATETLTTAWQQVTISLQGTAYADGVLGGFCWVATATDAGNSSIKFYIDDLQWQ